MQSRAYTVGTNLCQATCFEVFGAAGMPCGRADTLGHCFVAYLASMAVRHFAFEHLPFFTLLHRTSALPLVEQS